MASDTPKRSASGPTSVGEVVQYVKTYVQQETVDPLKNVGSWLKHRLPGAILLSIGITFLLLGGLRLLQTEFTPSLGTSFWPYLVMLVLVVGLLVLVIKRMTKPYLHAKDK